ncbi:transcriptional regulator, TetR family [Methylobacterium sp. 174MFSha1.1]|uniref:TetR/AcrR family transcriptional regulator n=1 Tax=Methylobacterium sp. 174MFSha1.1 TaxID=1502749 RepID=UPI0008E1E9EA|nr:TetR/AcrR family transcriptional regulator [Methylobacterium sp. 174MFSha1.1]SFU30302.1 transcriptional regulator, TetR family [Methylobacterium sp. 174MFSha1.1]
MTGPEAAAGWSEPSGTLPGGVTRIFRRDRTLRLPQRKWPVQARAGATIDAILEASAQLLETGRPTSTNAIAERAGVSIGTLYQYFDGRDAVVAALSRRLREALVVAVGEAAIRARREPRHVGLRRIVEAALAGDIRRPRLAATLDRLEDELALDADHAVVQAALTASLAGYLAHHGCDAADRADALADDLCAVARALTDTARSRGEAAGDPLVTRITRTLLALSE